MTYKLIHGDCIEVMQELIEENIKVDMVLTDLPYGTTNCKWDIIIPFEPMWDLINQLTSERTPIVFFGNEPFSSRLRLSNLKNYKYDIVWDKISRTGFLNANRQPLRQYENIMVFYQKQCYYNPIKWKGKEPSHPHGTIRKQNNNVYNDFGDVPYNDSIMKFPTNIVKVNSQRGECQNTNRTHPTQKPVELLEYLIKTYTRENDLVLDFTMGSGSTGIACQNLNRDFIGIELDEKYYCVARDRLKENIMQRKLI